MLRGFVPCVTSVRTLCYEPPVVVTAVVMTVSALAEAIGSELNTRNAAPEVEGRVAEMEYERGRRLCHGDEP